MPAEIATWLMNKMYKINNLFNSVRLNLWSAS